MTRPAKPRCAALDDKGNRCRRTSVRAIQYHGDGELYGFFSNGPEPDWVRADLCEVHSEKPKPKKAARP